MKFTPTGQHPQRLMDAGNYHLTHPSFKKELEHFRSPLESEKTIRNTKPTGKRIGANNEAINALESFQSKPIVRM
jgi:hypothetical protein